MLLAIGLVVSSSRSTPNLWKIKGSRSAFR
nr:MAG TPA: hypothetical protein [Caudoviricetes sp.]